MKYIFGPVNSRRLGISLGIDLIPYKTCTFDCVYCECGITTDHTDIVREYVPTDEVIQELDDYLSKHPRLDAVTFAGSGEPTLHSGIGRIIDFLKKSYPQYRVVILTNGSLFCNFEIRARVTKADIIIPSLDAASDRVFREINRPLKGVTVNDLLEGLKHLRAEYHGMLLLEIFIIPGANDTEEELGLLRDACRDIKPDGIQLNSLDRPGTENWVESAGFEAMEYVKSFFSEYPVEVLGKPLKQNRRGATPDNIRRVIVSTLERRPSTFEDLVSTTGAGDLRIQEVLDAMLKDGEVEKKVMERGEFIVLKKKRNC